MTVLESGLSVTSWLFAIPFILFFTIYVLELVFGLRRTIIRDNDVSVTAVDKPQLAILIPAHNEGSIITQTIAVLRENVPPQTRILVVADNCSDNTADLARKAGAEVVERSDDSNRGKGFALAFGRDQLANDPPDCVIILDADCTLAKGTAAKLASTAIGKSVPVQATNLIYSAAQASPVVQISNFAMLVKNLVRQRGMTRLGGAALLTGTAWPFRGRFLRQRRWQIATSRKTSLLAYQLPDRVMHPIFWNRQVYPVKPLPRRIRWSSGRGGSMGL